jgi:hypothetical protein
VSDEDRKEAVIERYLFVDNFRPSTTLYADIPMVLPGVDVFVLNDESLDRSENNFIIDNRMNFSNYLRFENLLPTVNIWDLFTYEYSTTASTSRHTGSSYPPSSIYYSSGGYAGNIPCTSVRNDEYRTDEGYWDTRTVYRTINETHDNTITKYYDSAGNHISNTYSWGGTNDHPYIYINEDGYSGNIPKTGWSLVSGPTTTYNDDGSYIMVTVYRGYYSGTLSKEETYWVSDWVWHDDYTGYYSGTIYKYVKQPYSNPYNVDSENFLVYVSDSGVSNMDDLLTVTSQNDVRIILIGNDSIKQQVSGYEYFIPNDGSDMEVLINKALDYIISQNPFIFETYTLLPGDIFNVNYANFDEEGDPIIEESFQYVHEPDFYDNPQGMEPGCVGSFNENSGWITTLRRSFTKPGRYTVFRQVKDRASSDPRFLEYNKTSNIPFFKVCVNRRPIALAQLDWTYDKDNSVYLTSWVDLSYDLDHQFSMENKGIVERSIRFRKNNGAWQYKIPSELTPGGYELEYYVKDVEGSWSEPFTMNFTLDENPPVQFDASLRSMDPLFSLSSIPADERLLAYDVWTRYPYDVDLEMAIFMESDRRTPVKTVSYSPDTGTKLGSDIYRKRLCIKFSHEGVIYMAE